MRLWLSNVLCGTDSAVIMKKLAATAFKVLYLEQQQLEAGCRNRWVKRWITKITFLWSIFIYFYLHKRSEKHPPPLKVTLLSFTFVFVPDLFLFLSPISYFFFSILLRHPQLLSSSLTLAVSILFLQRSLSFHLCKPFVSSTLTIFLSAYLSVSSLFVL